MLVWIRGDGRESTITVTLGGVVRRWRKASFAILIIIQFHILSNLGHLDDYGDVWCGLLLRRVDRCMCVRAYVCVFVVSSASCCLHEHYRP